MKIRLFDKIRLLSFCLSFLGLILTSTPTQIHRCTRFVLICKDSSEYLPKIPCTNFFGLCTYSLLYRYYALLFPTYARGKVCFSTLHSHLFGIYSHTSASRFVADPVCSVSLFQPLPVHLQHNSSSSPVRLGLHNSQHIYFFVCLIALQIFTCSRFSTS